MVQNVVNYVVILEAPNLDLRLIPGLTANSNIFIHESKNVYKIPTNAFAFTPTVEYILDNKLLPDSIKDSWLKKLRQISELKKQQIAEPNGTVGYLWIKSGLDIFPVKVTKGLNDGTFTEISGDIKEGYEVAIGINHLASATETQTSKSPFMPSFPTNKK
jgi:HlyD family secretion protein